MNNGVIAVVREIAEFTDYKSCEGVVIAFGESNAEYFFSVFNICNALKNIG